MSVLFFCSTCRKALMAEAKPEGQSKPARDFKKVFIWLFFLLNLGCMVGGAMLVYTATFAHDVVPLTEDDLLKDLNDKRFYTDETPLLLTMEPFTVNLASPNTFLKLDVSVSLLDEDGFEELRTKMPKARDGIMSVLQSKTYKDLGHLQGKLFLKEELIRSLNSMLREGVVKDIYFSDFIVQMK